MLRSGLIERIKQFATPVIILTWNQYDLVSELKKANIEVHVVKSIDAGHAYNDIRRKINYWFNHFRNHYPSNRIQEQYLRSYNPAKSNYRSKIIKFYNIFKHYLPCFTASLFKHEKALLNTNKEFLELKSWVNSLTADAVFTITPFHRQEDLLLRACKDCGLQMITSILSFDNITKRGWIPVEYDVYMVWNKYNKEELHSIYPITKLKPIYITGAPQFDFYNKKEWLFTQNEWQNSIGIHNKKKDKKIILYAGGPIELFPLEPLYLKHIDEAIEDNKIEGNPIVLFRCHPIDNIERWKNAIGETSNIIFDTSWTGKEQMHLANITKDDIKKLCSTLAYTDVHVNVCSTMTLDGSVFNKPQIGPAYLTESNKSKLLKRMYYQKHFEPIIKSKGIKLATTQEELIHLINSALSVPEEFNLNNTELLEQLITYTDGNCTERVAIALNETLNSSFNQISKR